MTDHALLSIARYSATAATATELGWFGAKPPRARSTGTPETAEPVDMVEYRRHLCCVGGAPAEWAFEWADAAERTISDFAWRERQILQQEGVAATKPTKRRRRKPCEGCGKPFLYSRATARFCTPACRQLAHRKKVAA